MSMALHKTGHQCAPIKVGDLRVLSDPIIWVIRGIVSDSDNAPIFYGDSICNRHLIMLIFERHGEDVRIMENAVSIYSHRLVACDECE